MNKSICITCGNTIANCQCHTAFDDAPVTSGPSVAAVQPVRGELETDFIAEHFNMSRQEFAKEASRRYQEYGKLTEQNKELREALKFLVDCYGVGNTTPEQFCERIHEAMMDARAILSRLTHPSE